MQPDNPKPLTAPLLLDVTCTHTILDFGFAFAQRCAINFWMGEALHSEGFNLRTAVSSV